MQKKRLSGESLLFIAGIRLFSNHAAICAQQELSGSRLRRELYRSEHIGIAACLGDGKNIAYLGLGQGDAGCHDVGTGAEVAHQIYLLRSGLIGEQLEVKGVHLGEERFIALGNSAFGQVSSDQPCQRRTDKAIEGALYHDKLGAIALLDIHNLGDIITA